MADDFDDDWEMPNYDVDAIQEQPPDIDMSDPEQEPQVISLTLPAFVARAKHLLAAAAMDTFAEFVLTGRYETTQYQVDAIKDALHDNHQIQALRDYDSVLGLHSNVCVNAPLTMYPVSRFEDTLRRNIHIKHSFTNQTVRIILSYSSSSLLTALY